MTPLAADSSGEILSPFHLHEPLRIQTLDPLKFSVGKAPLKSPRGIPGGTITPTTVFACYENAEASFLSLVSMKYDADVRTG